MRVFYEGECGHYTGYVSIDLAPSQAMGAGVPGDPTRCHICKKVVRIKHVKSVVPGNESEFEKKYHQQSTEHKTGEEGLG